MDKEISMDYELIAKVLFENFENIYDINLETSYFVSFHESEAFSKLELDRAGDDFFTLLPEEIARVVSPQDREYVRKMLSRENLIKGLEENKYYSFIYRLMQDDKDVYHQIRATYQPMEDGMHVFIGVRNIDEMIRQEQAHRDEISSMHQKETNHMEAVLASAAAYMEVNLSKDIRIETSEERMESDVRFSTEIPGPDVIQEYSRLHQWIHDNLIVENKERYMQVFDRDNLLRVFESGTMRSSTLFSVRTKDGEIQPCREVAFLYRERETKDIFAFMVIYDLTEQQKNERERERLENELRMSRLHNFTSQMQPHFLYNALGSIQEVILMDPEYASDLLGDFTVHLRSCIRAMTNDKPLDFSQELENIRAYVNIEKMRFGEKLRVHYDMRAMTFSILPLTIQPIVENAIRHGIYGRGADGGDVYISSYEDKDEWIVRVEDNGTGFDVESYRDSQVRGEGDSTGIKNIEFRLEKIMGAHMKIESQRGKGTIVTVRIPKNEN